MAAADACWARRDDIIAANKKDMEFGRNKGLSDAMMDRLMLDEDRIKGMCDGLRAVAAQDDPVGRGDGGMGPSHGPEHSPRAYPVGCNWCDLRKPPPT